MTPVVKISLPHIYRPRDYQREFFDALHSGKYRIFILNWHRRGGKDLTCWNAAIELTAEEVTAAKYGFPTSDMARDNLWESYTNDGYRFTDFVPLDLRVRHHDNDDGLNDTLKRIEFITGGSIRVISTHRPGRLRGGNSKVFVLSEFQIMDPIVIDIIEPILEANNGILIINMTSNGDSAARKMLKAWLKDPEVYVSIKSVKDTGVFTEKQMERIRRRTRERFVARGQSIEEADAFVDQEYYCSWDSPVAGSYFGQQIRDAEAAGRIKNVPYDPRLPVDTFWDIGIGDSMAIWFAQFLGNEIRLIDYFESSGEGLPYYASVLKGQHQGFERMARYVYRNHYMPHDVQVREVGSGNSRYHTALSLGISPIVTVKRPAQKDDGIHAIRMILPRCYFDSTNCERGINALKGYRKDWNEKLMVYKNHPIHDWTSHGTDALQTLALGYKEEISDDVDDDEPLFDETGNY